MKYLTKQLTKLVCISWLSRSHESNASKLCRDLNGGFSSFVWKSSGTCERPRLMACRWLIPDPDEGMKCACISGSLNFAMTKLWFRRIVFLISSMNAIWKSIFSAMTSTKYACHVSRANEYSFTWSRTAFLSCGAIGTLENLWFYSEVLLDHWPILATMEFQVDHYQMHFSHNWHHLRGCPLH